jgi:hypothetical protein
MSAGSKGARKLRQRLANGEDLFAFALDGARPVINLTSGWARRKVKLQGGAVDDFGDFDRFVLAEAEEACRRRAAMTGYAWHVDHMTPLARGGKHAWWNIQVIPARLNLWKGDALVLTQPGEWIGMLPGAGPDVFR